MKEKNIHEGCIEQIYRLYQDFLYASKPLVTDEAGRIRIDDLEMREDVQQQIKTLWKTVTQDNLLELADLDGYQQEFYKLFGFGQTNVDYDEPVETNVLIPSLESKVSA